jgi:hypothetical protein
MPVLAFEQDERLGPVLFRSQDDDGTGMAYNFA